MGLEFQFDNAKNTATISCYHVMKENKPILHVAHDEDDGAWQFLCGRAHNTEDAMVVSLYEVYMHDKSISAIADLPLGFVAERNDLNSDWQIYGK